MNVLVTLEGDPPRAVDDGWNDAVVDEGDGVSRETTRWKGLDDFSDEGIDVGRRWCVVTVSSGADRGRFPGAKQSAPSPGHHEQCAS